jgi:hypothetical protein
LLKGCAIPCGVANQQILSTESKESAKGFPLKYFIGFNLP